MLRVSRTSAQLWSLEVHQASSPLCGSPTWTRLAGRLTRTADSVPLGGREAWPSVNVGATAAVLEHLGLDPAEHVLAPRPHVGRQGLEEPTAVRAGAHQVPPADVGVGAGDRVVQVRQAEVVTVLVGDRRRCPHSRAGWCS